MQKVTPLPSNLDNAESLYREGHYLEKHPRWHSEHSEWKAAQVLRMIRRQRLAPLSICEIGCGAGGILRELQKAFPADRSLMGYDISPAAIALSARHANERLSFQLIRNETDIKGGFDLMVVVDVLEHIEDYFSFLRNIRGKAAFTIVHLPLDLSAQAVVRKNGLMKRRESHAHLHYFTKETALATLAEAGYQVVDWLYSARSLEIGSGVVQRLVGIPRRLVYRVHPDFAARVLGGFSLVVLAR